MNDKKNNHEVGEIIKKPWGNYHKIFQDADIWIKRIEVNPGARLSLQKHFKRSEKWMIVQGQGIAIVNDLEIPVYTGVVVDVPLEAVHRIGNPEKEPLVFIEIATGPYLAEDDIVRLEDDYERK